MKTERNGFARPYKPVGRCIYCGKIPEIGGLRREHIVPLGLGGDRILPKSSCRACEQNTGQTEQIVLRSFLDSIRYYMNTKGKRNRRETPDSLPVTKISNSDIIRFIAVNDYPFFVAMPILPRPGILLGTPPKDSGTMLGVKLSCPPRFSTAMMNVELDETIQLNMPLDRFVRMLAKIGHSYAIAELGYGAFHHCLPDLILGNDEWYGHYIGASDTDAEVSQYNYMIRIHPVNNLVTVDIQLLAFLDAPVYQVVVGTVRP